MDHLTTVGAGAALSAPLWITELNPYLQFAVGILGASWLAVQLYYKIKNERKKHK